MSRVDMTSQILTGAVKENRCLTAILGKTGERSGAQVPGLQFTVLCGLRRESPEER